MIERSAGLIRWQLQVRHYAGMARCSRLQPLLTAAGMAGELFVVLQPSPPPDVCHPVKSCLGKIPKVHATALEEQRRGYKVSISVSIVAQLEPAATGQTIKCVMAVWVCKTLVLDRSTKHPAMQS